MNLNTTPVNYFDEPTEEESDERREWLFAARDKRAAADEMIDELRKVSADLVDEANRTLNGDAAVLKAAAAVDMFADLEKFSEAVNEQLLAAENPADVDLGALQASLLRRNPEAFVPGRAGYKATWPMHQWTCTDTLIELRGSEPRVLDMLRPIPAGTELTTSDFFAGAGGSSSGLRAVPGLTVKLAVNHWDLAIETHQFNHQDTDHDQASLARTDPSRYPYTDLAWFSPECTAWSVAKGDKCDYDEASEQMALEVFADEEMETPEAKEAKWRSRMLMRDVVRFSRHHHYKAIIVENVPDILKWAAMDRWLGEMVAEGYRYKILTLNSAFAAATGAPAPQLRDRVYVVFWLAKYATPNWDKWLRPKGWCPGCNEVVSAIYNPKPGPRRPMRYGPRSQYTYRCPKKACQGQMVQPLVKPASEAIDFTLPTQRIGDRKKPLAKKTYDRVAGGVAKYWGAKMLVPTGGARSTTVTSLSEPMLTQTTTESRALVMPMEGRGEVSSIRPVEGPFRTQPARHQDALVQPPEGILVAMRNNGSAEPTDRPYRTFAAGGYHHALVMPYYGRSNATSAEEPLGTMMTRSHHALIMRNNQGGAEMSTPVDEPLRTLTTAGHQSLIGQPDQALYSYDTGGLRPLVEPLPAQTTIVGDAVVGGRRFVEVDDCTLRMLAVKEIQAGMAFDDDYVLLGKAKRNKVRMLGNAVTKNSARDLGACVMEAITGVDIPLFDDDPQLWLPN